MPSTCSIVISVLDKASLFSTQTQNCFLKTVCICSLFQSTLILKFHLLTVFMWFFSYRNDYCQVSGEGSCAAAPFQLASLEHHSLEPVFHLAVHPFYLLCPLWILSAAIFFPFLTVGLKGSQYCSCLWLGFLSLYLSSYNAVPPPVQTSKVVSSLKLQSQEKNKENIFFLLLSAHI